MPVFLLTPTLCWFFHQKNETRSCKAEGRKEIQPGSGEADAVCGPHISGEAQSRIESTISWKYGKQRTAWRFFLSRLAGTAPSGVIVSVLSVITALCLLILLLFCYKDKLKLLSGRLNRDITPVMATISRKRKIQQSSDVLAGTLCFSPHCFNLLLVEYSATMHFRALAISISSLCVAPEHKMWISNCHQSFHWRWKMGQMLIFVVNYPNGKRLDIYTLRLCMLDKN